MRRAGPAHMQTSFLHPGERHRPDPLRRLSRHAGSLRGSHGQKENDLRRMYRAAPGYSCGYEKILYGDWVSGENERAEGALPSALFLHIEIGAAGH